MKTWNSLSESGPAATLLLAGVLVLATGCVGERVTYVQQAGPVVVQESEPPPPPPEVAPSAAAVELPPVPPPAPVTLMRSAAELDTMLAPIALYPDPLLAQLFPAATLPEQVVLADRYLRDGGDVNQVDAQPWDNSLKALARYPAVLNMLDDNLAWTTDLGQAFLNQPADVMDSVQRLRAQARALGNLVSTPQQTVEVNEGAIEIVPAAPEVIYVPVYQPEVVYVQPPPSPGRLFISFGVGLRVGAWLNHDCDWQHHDVIVWHHDHPRPVDWWYRPPSRRELPPAVHNVTIVNNTTVVNRTVTVWHPHTRGAAATQGDRGWGQQAVRAPAPVRDVGHQALVAVAAQKPVPTREIRPTPPAKEPRPSQATAQRPSGPAPTPRANPPREPVKPAPSVPSQDVHTAPPPHVTAPTPAPPREASNAKPPVREVRPGQPAVQRPPIATPEPLPNAPLEPAKPKPLITPHEVRTVPPPTVTPPAPVPPRETSTVKPPAKPAAPETARAGNSQPLQPQAAKPAPRSNQPIPAPKDPRPAPAPVPSKPTPVAASSPKPAAPSPASHVVATAPARAPSSALAGIESSRVTREASTRGQQSREAVAKPAPAPRPAPAPVSSPKASPAQPKRGR